MTERFRRWLAGSRWRFWRLYAAGAAAAYVAVITGGAVVKAVAAGAGAYLLLRWPTLPDPAPLLARATGAAARTLHPFHRGDADPVTPQEDPVSVPLYQPPATRVPADTIVGAVLDILDDHPEGVSATELLNRLPEHIRPTSAVALGIALKQHPEAVQPGWVRHNRVWRPVHHPSANV